MFERLTIGAWAITAAGCPVRVVMDEHSELATLVFGSTNQEFEICLDAATLTEVINCATEALVLMTKSRDHRSGAQ